MNTEQLSKLFAVDVEASIATAEMYDAPLFAAEYSAIGRARLVRQREFAAGRAAARAALEKLGVTAAPLPPNADKLPEWPVGYVGSISHCHGFCCSVVARARQARSLGVDVENASPLEPDLYRLVFDDRELIHLEEQQEMVNFDLYKVGFSAKEAFYKCYYPIAKQFLDFKDVTIRIDPVKKNSNGKFSLIIKDSNKLYSNLDHRIIGSWHVNGDHVFTGATLLN